MEICWKNMIYLIAFGFIFVSLCETKSVYMKNLIRRKRFLNAGFAVSCPPPFHDPSGDEACPTNKPENTCRYDDECQDFDELRLCCFNGCNNLCMIPVKPPPVIDWPITYRAPKEPIGEGLIELVAPHVKEGGCMFKGVSHNEGEKFSSGCRKCECSNGEVTCSVISCFPEDLITDNKETGGYSEHSGNGPQESSELSRINDDSESDDDGNRIIGEEQEERKREKKQSRRFEGKKALVEKDEWWLEK